MSHRVRSNNARKNTSCKSFCKICKDAGKSFSIYTSHNIRDSNNRVCCPILIASVCMYCSGLGHIAKFCPSIRKKEKETRRLQFNKKDNPSVSVNNTNKKSGMFACLDSSSDLESEDDSHIEGDSGFTYVPYISADSSSVTSELSTNDVYDLDDSNSNSKCVIENNVPIFGKKPQRIIRSWADMDSSDED